MFNPVYVDEMMDRNVRTFLEYLNCYSEDDELFWAMAIQYFTILVMTILIAQNIQSFMRQMLFTIKRLMRDYSIKVENSTTILIFAQLMGVYYLAILL